MNIPDLEAFIAVVETGSIGAAALRLNLTQPGVTRRVQSLEQTLGMPLLDRRCKPPRLTTAGRAAYDQARRVMHAVLDMTTAFEPGATVSGELRLGMSAGLGAFTISETVSHIRAAYPNLHLQLTTTWSEPLLQKVQSGTLDAAVIMLLDGATPPDGVQGHPIARDTGIVVAGLNMAVPTRARLDELATMPWVLDHDGCALRRVLIDALAAKRRALEPSIVVAGAELQLSLVARGHGLGLVLPRTLRWSSYRDTVQQITVKAFHPTFTVWLVHSPYIGQLAAPITSIHEALSTQMTSDVA